MERNFTDGGVCQKCIANAPLLSGAATIAVAILSRLRMRIVMGCCLPLSRLRVCRSRAASRMRRQGEIGEEDERVMGLGWMEC